jgi:signal transduction histidine kinase
LPALGNLRYRIDGRLRAVGIELDWQVDSLPALPYLTPRTVLHILRILQEVFANVLKHAKASSVQLEAGFVRGQRRVFIRVRDNGQGFVEPQRRGRGLANMTRRALSIGGELSVSTSSQGTTVELLLPVA